MQCNIIVFTDYLTDVLNIRKLFSLLTRKQAIGTLHLPEKGNIILTVLNILQYIQLNLSDERNRDQAWSTICTVLKGSTSRDILINLL